MFIVIILIVMEIIAVYTAIISIIVFAKEDSGIRLDRAIFWNCFVTSAICWYIVGHDISSMDLR